MKYFIATVLLATCLAIEAKNVPSSSAITLLDYFKQHKDDSSRIISGELAAVGQFPHQAAIYMNKPGGISELCGGTIISSKWILTAAHCIADAESWDIKLGSIYRQAGEPGEVIVSTNKAVVHPEFDSQSLHNDIAVIELLEEISFTATIQPLRLPTRAESGDRLVNRRPRVSGWGHTSDNSPEPPLFLSYVDLDIISNEECIKYFNSALIVSSTLCCKGRPEHSICQGDSGGPLILTSADGKLTHIGIVSFTSSYGCTLGFPSGFIRTSDYLDWISQVTNIPVRE